MNLFTMPATVRAIYSGLVLASLVPLFVFAAVINGRGYAIKEEIHPPRGWIKHGKPFPDHPIALQIGLPQHNFPILERRLYEVSDPSHKHYGQHLSRQEVEELVSPQADSLDSISRWLESFNVGEKDITRSPAKDWIRVTLPVRTVEEMLDTVRHILTVDSCVILMDG